MIPKKSRARRYFAARFPALAAIALLVLAMGGTWESASAAPTLAQSSTASSSGGSGGSGSGAAPKPAAKSAHKELSGKLNLNQATPEQLALLPSVGPTKADRIVEWRKKNGGFKRVADLRRVKGFGYKTFKRLEPYLDVKGDTTLAVK